MLNTSTGANKTSSLTGEAWRIQNKEMPEGQKTMNSIPPMGRQGAHYTQQENKSQLYVMQELRILMALAAIGGGSIFSLQVNDLSGCSGFGENSR